MVSSFECCSLQQILDTGISLFFVYLHSYNWREIINFLIHSASTESFSFLSLIETDIVSNPQLRWICDEENVTSIECFQFSKASS